MSIRITSRPKFESLVSPGPDRQTPIYNWHTFKHSYSRQLVENLTSEFRLKKGAWVLDPFCGGGTTLLSSKQSGINSQGFDILPFSVFLSNVKVRHYDEIELIRDLRRISQISNITQNAVLPADIELLNKAFPEPIKSELLRLKASIDKISKRKNRDFFNLAFLGILESVSNTSKDGGFLRIIARNETPQNILSKFIDRCARMIADVITVNNCGNNSNAIAKARLADARYLPTDRGYDAVITSPPYPNRHDYTRIYLLEMAFDFISNNQDLKDIRYKTLRSHVEARKRFEAGDYEPPKKLIGLLKKIRTNGTNNSKIIQMVEGYFEDMFLCLRQMKLRLNENGKIGLVVSNVRFSGITLPVDTLLSDIGAQIGLKPTAIWTARKRGNSAQQMKQYSRNPSRESIVVWAK
jgi:site-specific DNA-adenine methylase